MLTINFFFVYCFSIIVELYNSIRSEIHVIYSMIDIITELDVLLALAEFSKARGAVRPTFRGYTEVIEAIHPLMEYCWKAKKIVPNSFVSFQFKFPSNRYLTIFFIHYFLECYT